MEKEKFNATAYKNDFISKHYERINLTVPKGQKDVIKKQAEKRGKKSVNEYINHLIEEDIKKDTR